MPSGADGLAALRVDELDPHLALVQVHAVVALALAGQRPDERLAAVVEQLHAEPLRHLLSDARRQRFGGGEADPVAQAATLPLRDVGEVGEEGGGTDVDSRPQLAGHAHLQLGVADAAIDHPATEALEGAVHSQAARHDVIRESDVRHVVAPHAHVPQALVQRLDAGRLLGGARDVERAGRDAHAGDAVARHGEQRTEGRVGLLGGRNLALARHRQAAEILRRANLPDVDSGELLAIERRRSTHPPQGLHDLRPGSVRAAGRRAHRAGTSRGRVDVVPPSRRRADFIRGLPSSQTIVCVTSLTKAARKGKG